MAASDTQKQLHRTIHIMVGAWALAMLGAGIAFAAFSWGVVLIAGGVITAGFVVIGMVLRQPLIALYGSLLTLASGMIAVGGLYAGQTWAIVFLVAGLFGLLLLGLSAAMALHLGSSGLKRGSDAMPMASSRIEELLTRIHEQAMLSDNAKRVLFRETELQLLRNAIEEDIARGDYNAGLLLCDEMSKLFGYREEAEVFRSRIMQVSHERFESQVQHALDQFSHLLVQRDWARAHQEAARIRRLFPDSHIVQELDHRIHAARDEHKAQLEAQFLHAAQNEDVEAAMSLLRELDRYLTRDEAARIATVAGGVVSRHRENLSTQFKLAVNDRRWAEAAQIGQTIIDEFPNTKMADEVRSLIDVLRTRATQAAVAAAGNV